MAEQNQAPNPPQGLNVPAAGAPDPSISAYPPASAYPTRRSYKRWVFLASFVVLAVAGAFLWHYLSGFESTDDAQVDVHLYPVSACISLCISRS
jgi:membrane fusion protein (multidrug efflux system)